MYMNKGLDTGDMLLKDEVEILPDDNFESIHDKLGACGAELLLAALRDLESGKLTAEKQDESLATYAKKIEKSDCLIDFSLPADAIHNLESARKNGFTLFGCALGFLVVYTIDLKWTKFDTKAVWWAQLIKAGGGLLVVLLIKEGLKVPLNLIFDENTVARCLRYFLMVVAGGALWPMTFKWFSKLGQKKE